MPNTIFHLFASFCDPRNGKISQSSASYEKIVNFFGSWLWEVCLDRECVEFVTGGLFKMNFYDFIIGSWSMQ